MQDQIAVSKFSNFEYRMAKLEEEVSRAHTPLLDFENEPIGRAGEVRRFLRNEPKVVLKD